jgi:hypothetical protein
MASPLQKPMGRSPLGDFARLRSEAGVCLTCGSYTCGGIRNIHPSQTKFDIRTAGAELSRRLVPSHQFTSSSGSPGAIPITIFTVCKNVTR